VAKDQWLRKEKRLTQEGLFLIARSPGARPAAFIARIGPEAQEPAQQHSLLASGTSNFDCLWEGSLSNAPGSDITYIIHDWKNKEIK
jgi:hypothetical protein